MLGMTGLPSVLGWGQGDLTMMIVQSFRPGPSTAATGGSSKTLRVGLPPFLTG